MAEREIINRMCAIFIKKNNKILPFTQIAPIFTGPQKKYLNQKFENFRQFLKKHNDLFDYNGENITILDHNFEDRRVEIDEELGDLYLQDFKKNISTETFRKFLSMFSWMPKNEQLQMKGSQSNQQFIKRHPEVFQLNEEKNKARLRKDIQQFNYKRTTSEPHVIPELKNHEFIYSVDFEMAITAVDFHIPLEIACVKIKRETGEIVGRFHEFINPKVVIPGYMQKTVNFAAGKIHGITLSHVEKTVNKNLEKIMDEFSDFIGFKSNPEVFLFSKGNKAEMETFNWIFNKLKKPNPFHVLDIVQVLRMYTPEMTNEDAKLLVQRCVLFLSQENKCHFHIGNNETYHCALDDVEANSALIKSIIQNGTDHLLTQEVSSRKEKHKKRKKDDDDSSNKKQKK